jgi:hypothetical protein
MDEKKKRRVGEQLNSRNLGFGVRIGARGPVGEDWTHQNWI